MILKHILLSAVTAIALSAGAASAEESSVAIGISGWTGFAPLTLAKEAGLFKKNGLDVDVKKIPQKDRPLAIASGAIQCAATTVETFMIWNANGVPIKQLFQLDMSHGADGIAGKPDIKSIADLKGKTVAASTPGTSPYFMLAWILDANGLTLDDVNVVNLEPGPAAEAFVAGQNDAAVTYEPYLSTIRNNPKAGKILATTVDYPMVMDTFGCTPDFIAKNPGTVKALAKSYYEALDMIKADPAKSNEIMGADVKQSAAEFADSAKYLEWQDMAASKAFMSRGINDFYAKAGPLLMKIGTIKAIPDASTLADTSWMK